MAMVDAVSGGVSAVGSVLNGTAQSSAAQSVVNSASAASSSTVYYPSPVFTFDAQTGAAIIEYRDTQTGLELSQTPSKIALEYQRSQNLVPQVR